MIAANGIRSLARVDYVIHSHNLFIVAIAIGVGMIPLVADHFFQALPASLGPLLGSGILLAAVAAVPLDPSSTARRAATKPHVSSRRARAWPRDRYGRTVAIARCPGQLRVLWGTPRERGAEGWPGGRPPTFRHLKPAPHAGG
jgi:hypothetical protein